MSRYVSKLVDSLSDDSMGMGGSMGGMGMGSTKGTTNISHNNNYNGHHDGHQRFVLRPCPADPNLTLIHPKGYPVEAPPLFTVIISSGKVSLYRGYINPGGLVGTTSTSSMSSSATMMLYGQRIPIKASQLSGSFSLQWPAAGTLKWKSDQLTGGSLELSDGSGRKLAKFKSSSSLMGSGEKGFEINVPCDEQFLSLIVLSGLAAKAGTKKNNEAASEIIQAVAGA